MINAILNKPPLGPTGRTELNTATMQYPILRRQLQSSSYMCHYAIWLANSN